MTGLVQDAGGRCHSILALPEGLNVGGHLDLRGTNITALPQGLSVDGHLDLRGTNITALPEGLRCTTGWRSEFAFSNLARSPRAH
jgi:hypothetical protein